MDLGSSVIGVWRLIKFVSEETATGNVDMPFGSRPRGHIIFTAGGHVMALGVGTDRTSLSGTEPTDGQRAALFKSLFAYSGRYRLEGDKIVHEVEASWNESWTGTKQVRVAKVEGNELVVKTAPFRSPQSGEEVVATALWERVE